MVCRCCSGGREAASERGTIQRRPGAPLLTAAQHTLHTAAQRHESDRSSKQSEPLPPPPGRWQCSPPCAWSQRPYMAESWKYWSQIGNQASPFQLLKAACHASSSVITLSAASYAAPVGMGGARKAATWPRPVAGGAEGGGVGVGWGGCKPHRDAPVHGACRRACTLAPRWCVRVGCDHASPEAGSQAALHGMRAAPSHLSPHVPVAALRSARHVVPLVLALLRRRCAVVAHLLRHRTPPFGAALHCCSAVLAAVIALGERPHDPNELYVRRGGPVEAGAEPRGRCARAILPRCDLGAPLARGGAW